MNDQVQAGVQPPAPQAPPAPEAEPKRLFAPCPCGNTPERLLLEVSEQSKVGKAMGDCCGMWGVEFLRGVETEPEKILDKAHAAWDAAPRTKPLPVATPGA